MWCVRITPAYAGKTLLSTPLQTNLWDHPRVCGKNCPLSLEVLRGLGSPPRMREKHICACKRALANGITPAYAGKTCKKTPPVRVPRDHPRVCGKNLIAALDEMFSLGSPPRMREKRDNITRGRLRDGITPAYAGKTLQLA